MNETQFQRNVMSLAENLGWETYHPRRDPRHRSVATGTMAKGWPDLILTRVRCGDGRVIVAELKADDGRLSPEQIRVLDALNMDAIEIYVWSPKDWPEIERTLA